MGKSIRVPKWIDWTGRGFRYLITLSVEEATEEATAAARDAVFAQLADLSEQFADQSLAALLPVIKGDKDLTAFQLELKDAEIAALKAQQAEPGSGTPNMSESAGVMSIHAAKPANPAPPS